LTDVTQDVARGTGVELWTLGHSLHDPKLVLELLNKHEIDLVIDVRSVPYSYAEQYNKDSFERLLAPADIAYDWRGNGLGGIPPDDSFYDAAGHTLYEPLAATAEFRKAIGGVEFAAERQMVALVCVEEPPERCHRHYLLARVLTKRGAVVHHIRADGSVEDDAVVAARLPPAQGSLFGQQPTWRSPEPMRDKADLPRPHPDF
jgi:uncharacterized protein (DUF488 family)